MTEGAQADIRYGGRNSRRWSEDWLTPAPLKQAIYERWQLDYDPCPHPRPEGDGLVAPWHGRAYVNPPYGNQTVNWVRKALSELEFRRIDIAVFLIHARTDTRTFHDFILPRAEELYFVRGRVRFERPDGSSASSPFPSMIVVFDRQRPGPPKVDAWPPFPKRTPFG